MCRMWNVCIKVKTWRILVSVRTFVKDSPTHFPSESNRNKQLLQEVKFRKIKNLNELMNFHSLIPQSLCLSSTPSLCRFVLDVYIQLQTLYSDFTATNLRLKASSWCRETIKQSSARISSSWLLRLNESEWSQDDGGIKRMSKELAERERSAEQLLLQLFTSTRLQTWQIYSRETGNPSTRSLRGEGGKNWDWSFR